MAIDYASIGGRDRNGALVQLEENELIMSLVPQPANVAGCYYIPIQLKKA